MYRFHYPEAFILFASQIINTHGHERLDYSEAINTFKSGDRDELGNYRPISVIPTIARVFEKLIYNQLHTYFMDNNLLSNEQYGFRSIHSTALALSRASNN